MSCCLTLNEWSWATEHQQKKLQQDTLVGVLGVLPPPPQLLPAVASRWRHFCSPCPAAPEVGALSAIAKEAPERALLPPHPHSRIANCFHGLSCKLQDLGSFIYSVYTAAEKSGILYENHCYLRSVRSGFPVLNTDTSIHTSGNMLSPPIFTTSML